MFGLNSSFRFGLSWLGEITLFIKWEDDTESQDWGCKITEFQHLAARYRPGVADIFLNGIKQFSLTNPNTHIADYSGITLGRYDNGSYISGSMQDLKIYEWKPDEYIKVEFDALCGNFIVPI
jgi:hypothetical protein